MIKKNIPFSGLIYCYNVGTPKIIQVYIYYNICRIDVIAE